MFPEVEQLTPSFRFNRRRFPFTIPDERSKKESPIPFE